MGMDGGRSCCGAHMCPFPDRRRDSAQPASWAAPAPVQTSYRIPAGRMPTGTLPHAPTCLAAAAAYRTWRHLFKPHLMSCSLDGLEGRGWRAYKMPPATLNHHARSLGFVRMPCCTGRGVCTARSNLLPTLLQHQTTRRRCRGSRRTRTLGTRAARGLHARSDGLNPLQPPPQDCPQTRRVRHLSACCRALYATFEHIRWAEGGRCRWRQTWLRRLQI